MASRRRAVERAASRRTVADRVVAGVLLVVLVAGLMSVLPSSSQRAVSATVCRIGTVGLGTCGSPGLDLTDAQLAPARCRVLADLDAALPEVRVRALRAAHDLPVTISTARSGDVVVQLGDEPQPPLPAVLDGAARPRRHVADGVDVPAGAEWFLPRGQGLDELVGAVQDREHQQARGRSALALLGGVLDPDDRVVPAPTLLASRLDLRDPVLPAPTGLTRPGPTGSWVRVQADRPGVVVFNRVTQESALVTAVAGNLDGAPVTGTLRITRDAAGTPVSVLLAVVARGALLPGEQGAEGAAVAYVQVPVTTPTERQLVGSWLAGNDAVVVPLDGLLGLEVPAADDLLGSFLVRAATVTELRYAAVDAGVLADRTAAELRDGRRQDWSGVRLVEAAEVVPTSSGRDRVAVVDGGCST